jgi:DNA-binding MarR family transcriptional regulator
MGIERVYFGEELIGLAATNNGYFPRDECDAHPSPDSADANAHDNIVFDALLLALAEDIYRVRRKRDVQFEQFFGDGLFCEPAWDMVLDLYINNGRNRMISVSSACLASAVPTTTALRHISELVRRRLVVRSPHPVDRRAFILHLSPLAVSVMEGLLRQQIKADNMSHA